MSAWFATPPTPIHDPSLAWLDALIEAACVVDGASLCVLAANAPAARLWQREWHQLVGQSVLKLAETPEDLAFWTSAERPDALHSDSLIVRGDGKIHAVERRISRLTLANGRPGWVLCLNDRDESRQLADSLDRLGAELAATLAASSDAVLVTDLSGAVRCHNTAFAQLFGLPEDAPSHALLALPEHIASQLADPAGYRALVERDHARLDDRESLHDRPDRLCSTDTLQMANGRTVERRAVPQYVRGHAVGWVQTWQDRTEALAQQRRVHQLTHQDAVTGLPNRLQLGQLLDAEVQNQYRHPSRSGGFAMLVLGVERLARITEALGHRHADRVMTELAQRLSARLRHHDRLARLDDDRYAVLLHGCEAAAVDAAARRLLAAFDAPVAVGALRLPVQGSIGIACYPAHGRDSSTLLRNAERALRRARAQHGGAVCRHDPKAESDLLARLQLDQAMRDALAGAPGSGSFRLEYQPQLNLADGRMIGVEALCRFRDVQGHAVSPQRFIEVAEDTGFISELGDWVLHRAVAQAAAWHRDGLDLAVSVNVSVLQFQADGFVARVRSLLAEHALPAARLELELTESLLVGDVEAVVAQMQQLADLGVRLAIDDFGTGYASLRYLKALPVHRLKIDRAFIAPLPDGRADGAIARNVIELGHGLGLEVVAEGVETEAQRAWLVAAGCDAFQGWLCAPALPAEDVPPLVAPRQRLRA